MISLKWVCDGRPELAANSASEAADIAAANDFEPEYLTWSQKLVIDPPGASNG